VKEVIKMRAINSNKAPAWATLVAALVAALVSLFVFAQSAQSARAQDQHHDNKIIGGTAVPDGKYPFMVALLDTRFGSTAFEQQFCGGTLIDEDSVLTAAHCVFGESAAPLRVIVGRTVLDSNQGQKRSVSEIFIHPLYNPSLNDARDAAVLELSSPVSGIAPIKLATSSQNFLESPGQNATVAGWGNTIAQPAGGSAGSSFPDRMREAQVSLVSDAQAKSVYKGAFVASLMVAAGHTGKDTCQGDSGGPMFAKAASKYRQIGITSFGIGCAADGFPGVYTEVNASPIRSFITNAASN
jgi:secreted trypsin-like serine protease